MSKIEIDAKNIIVSPLDRARVYPLIATFPLNAKITLKDVARNSVYGGITSADLIEATIGSLVLVKDAGLLRQIPFVTPNASTISEILDVSKKGTPFDLASVPSRVSLDAGLVYLVFDLTNIYNALWGYLASKFSKNAPNELVIPVNKDSKIKCTIIKEDVESINKSDNISSNSSMFNVFDVNLDPKAIVKATIYPHVCTWAVRIMDLKQGFHNTLSFVQPIDYLMINLNIKPEIIKSIIQEAVVQRSVTQEFISLKFLRLRSRALSNFINILFEGLNYNVDPFLTILEAYCSFIVKRGQKYIRRASKTNRISLNIISYSQALAYALIEMGLHGISHSLVRYIAAKLKLDVSRLREFIGVIVDVPSHVDDPRKALNTYVGVIDGYIFRAQLDITQLRGASPGSMFGIVGAILPRPYSRKIIETIFPQDVGKQKIHGLIINYINKAINLGGIDSCYKVWLSNKGIADATFNRIINALSRLSISRLCTLSLGGLLSDIKDETENKFNIRNIQSPNDLVKILYIPRVDYRRVLVRTILRNVIKNRLQRLGVKDPKIYDSYRNEAIDRIKPYVPMIYETSVPYCFDGCYNCVLLKDCGSKHPIIREWIISKALMKIILQGYLSTGCKKCLEI